MWNKNNQKNMEDPSNSSNIISKGTILTGNLQAHGNVRVEGKIIGDVTTRAKLALGSSSVIQGNILAQQCRVCRCHNRKCSNRRATDVEIFGHH